MNTVWKCHVESAVPEQQAELAEIRKKIKNEAQVARESLQKEVASFASQICQKILGRAV